MKKYVFFVLVIFAAATSCKSKKQAASSASNSTSASTEASLTTSTAAGNTSGKISHKYKDTGCATVIVFTKDGTEITLIPKDKLAADMDVDGLDVTFNYRSLKMPNPAGCNVGMPAEITDLAKK